MKYLLYATLLLFCCTHSEKGDRSTTANEPQMRIITMGGTITEIVHELGFGESIVATDKTSTYPEKMQDLPSVGYRNGIKTEGILSLSPTLLLVEEGYLSDEVISQLHEAKISLYLLPVLRSLDNTFDLIDALGDILDQKSAAEKLKETVKQDLKQLSAYLEANQQGNPTVLFVFARGKGSINTSGTGTFAETFIEGAGGVLALPEVEGTRPLSTEILLRANPEYLLLFTSGLQSIGGVTGVMEIPGVKETKAGQAKKIIDMDGNLMSGFGPRVGQAMLSLAKQLHPPIEKANL